MKKLILLAILSAMTAQPAQAGITDMLSNIFSKKTNNVASPNVNTVSVNANSNGAHLGSDCLKSLEEERKAKIDKDGQIIDGVIKVPEKGIADLPCLKKYENFKITSVLGLPSFGDVIDKIKNDACKMVDQKVNDANQAVSQTVSIGSGGIINGTINTSTISTNGGLISGGGIGGGNVTTSTTTNNTASKFPNIFQ